MMGFNWTRAIAVILVGLVSPVLYASGIDGQPDHEIDDLGYYYTITGGLFPTGTEPNGDNGSGGTFRFLVDDPAWGPYTIGEWNKDDWFSDNAGIGLTLRDGASIVYDNNGLEPDAATAADPNYYDYFGGNYPTGGHGAHVAYSMSNNYDWIYAGYFKIEEAEVPTTVTSITGYFAYSGNPNDPLTGPFDPNNPVLRYRMNIWSNVEGDLLPSDTGSFDGDVFTSDTSPGTFSWSDTGFDRVGSTSTQNIYRLTYTLDSEIILQPGDYWFSHDVIVPEPASLGLIFFAAIGGLMLRRSAK